MITMVKIEDVKAIIERHLDWRVANEDAAKRRILSALDKLTDIKELAARDRVRARLAPFSVGPSYQDADDTMGVRP